MGERAQQCQNRRFAESSWKSPMKILTLRLKNLNSLKGEWKIDFTAEPFASSGLLTWKRTAAGRVAPRPVASGPRREVPTWAKKP